MFVQGSSGQLSEDFALQDDSLTTGGGEDGDGGGGAVTETSVIVSKISTASAMSVTSREEVYSVSEIEVPISTKQSSSITTNRLSSEEALTSGADSSTTTATQSVINNQETISGQ